MLIVWKARDLFPAPAVSDQISLFSGSTLNRADLTCPADYYDMMTMQNGMGGGMGNMMGSGMGMGMGYGGQGYGGQGYGGQGYGGQGMAGMMQGGYGTPRSWYGRQ